MEIVDMTITRCHVFKKNDIEFKIGDLGPGLFWTQVHREPGPRTEDRRPGPRTQGPGPGDPATSEPGDPPTPF